MKKLILWLAKVFDVDLVRVERITEYKYLTSGVIKGDIHVAGNLVVDGELKVSGGITFYKEER